MSVQTIMVAGAGQMGAGIAQVAATAGYTVLLHDRTIELASRGLSSISVRLQSSIDKGRLAEGERNAILARIQPVSSLEEAITADAVIEAITENLEAKTALLRKLDEVCPVNVIFASNTSSLPITELAAATGRPAMVIGMHFMNPVPVMPLVEVIRGLETSEHVYEAVRELALKLGKTPVEVHDYPGFVANRILMPMINEAVFAVYEGVASVESVDRVMKLGMNHPMGPLELADFIGLDTCLSIMEILYEGFKDPKYRPCPLLRKYVKAGRLGKKCGRGFHLYESGVI